MLDPLMVDRGKREHQASRDQYGCTILYSFNRCGLCLFLVVATLLCPAFIFICRLCFLAICLNLVCIMSCAAQVSLSTVVWLALACLLHAACSLSILNCTVSWVTASQLVRGKTWMALSVRADCGESHFSIINPYEIHHSTMLIGLGLRRTVYCNCQSPLFTVSREYSIIHQSCK